MYKRKYSSQWWFIHRRRQLDKQPLCQECFKRNVLTTATEVDHIIPHRNNDILFYDKDNLQSLCKTCHGRKSRAERLGVKSI